MGPHTFNFKHICATLESAEGLITVVDATSLVEKITDLLGDENTRLYHGFHAVTVLRKNQGALQRLLRLLEPYLPDRIH